MERIFERMSLKRSDSVGVNVNVDVDFDSARKSLG